MAVYRSGCAVGGERCNLSVSVAEAFQNVVGVGTEFRSGSVVGRKVGERAGASYSDELTHVATLLNLDEGLVGIERLVVHNLLHIEHRTAGYAVVAESLGNLVFGLGYGVLLDTLPDF